MTTPELDERRIEAMRSSIMHTVDADVARRGRRTRRGLGVLAAACFVVVVGGVGFSNLANPNAGMSESGDSAGSRAATEPGVAGDNALQDSTEKAAPEVAPRDTREVITTGSVDVTVKDPRDVAERFSAWVESRDGRIDGRTESKDDEGRTSASLTIRVPSAQMSKALTQLATYGDVGTVDIQNEDVTALGQDLDARIRALEISIDRLEKILADADSSAEVVRAEGALTQRQEQLESLQTQRKALSEQVALSTLHVELIEKGSAASVSPGGFQGGLTKGWNALVETVNGIVSLAGVLVPWLAVALVVWVLWRVARRVSRA
ncbi:DUF4349 domain-containing protein [Aeromicrobium sp.]|uniref:DUF4349 domain-containing protein n=1 Tax=Aeromicrobium sp. TaxID=1871063 RepID=UPI003D6B6502